MLYRAAFQRLMRPQSNAQELREESNKVSLQKASCPSWKHWTRRIQVLTQWPVPETVQEMMSDGDDNKILFLEDFHLQYLCVFI